MEGKTNSMNHMGDVVLSPLQQQNYGGGSHSPVSTSSALDLAKGAVKMPTISFANVISQHLGEQPEESEEDLQEQIPGNANRKKGFRKRKKSLHAAGGGGGSDGNYLPPYKHRRMFIRRHLSCPPGGAGGLPLKFLLGGNAHDPLNLNGLGDSDNAVTPKTSPMPGHHPPHHHLHQNEIPIMIPKNYQDPLRLLTEDDVENTRDVIEGILPEVPTQQQQPHKRRRHRKRSLRKRNESECSIESLASDDGDVEADVAEVIAKYKSRDLRDDNEPAEVDGSITKVAEGSLTVASEVKEEQSSGTKKREDGKEVEAELTIPATADGTRPPVATYEGKGDASPQAVMADLEPTFPFRVSSEYIPLSSHYQPSPFVLDTMNENFTVLPFESPSMSNYMDNMGTYTGGQDTFTITEPFSPPPRPLNMDVIIEHRVPSGHYGLGWTPPRNEIQRRQLPPPPTVTQQAMFNRRHRHRLDPIVSPVFPNLSSGKRSWIPHGHGHLRHNHKNKQQQEPKAVEESRSEKEAPKSEPTKKPAKKFRPKDEIFRFGNYNQYYGYRNNGQEEDARLRAFKKEWLEGKDVLDVGCNIGHMTLCLARDCAPRRIVGIDIDGYLIKVANKNIKHYVDRDPNDVSIKFPQALSVVHGSLQPPQLEAVAVGCTPEQGGTPGEQQQRKRIPFPYNVCFRQENYVLDADDLLNTVKPQYDVIVCLSTTKWVHLNFGDDGLKRFFRRAYANLRAGGLFILEPQPWSSYKKKKKLTEEIFKTFQSIKFHPKDFESFLLKDLGYTSVKLVGIPAHHSKGFQRPIYVFTKGPGKALPSSTVTSGAAVAQEMEVSETSAENCDAGRSASIPAEETGGTKEGDESTALPSP